MNQLPPQRLPDPYRPEREVLAALLAQVEGALDWPAVIATASPWVEAVRRDPPPFWAMESLLKEYPITSAEGLALMRLAEALLRVPDAETAGLLTADQLGRADFAAGAGDGALARLSGAAIALSKRLLPDAQAGGQAPGLAARLGARTVVAATLRAVQLLGRQFVLGQTIADALDEAARQRREATARRLAFSYDMLGEGARTAHDAARYQAAYQGAISNIAAQADPMRPVAENDGISIKLSALHPRYEAAQHARVLAELVPRVWPLCEAAARANIGLTIDAEEVDRLELSLAVFEALAERVQAHCPHWQGFGLALQAYQSRALPLIDHVAQLARRLGLRFMCRLVKGAYWDAEIKRAQEAGLPHYPVFTRKPHTDVSYLACARALLDASDVIYPQFATHNAGTIAAIAQMAARTRGARPAAGPPQGGSASEGLGVAAPGLPAQAGTARSAGASGGGLFSEPRAAGSVGAHGYELQRLHGMGQGVYREVGAAGGPPVRVYAPVGQHRDLLAYLVRRLLENGANSSFVHQLADDAVPPEALLASPLAAARATLDAALDAPHHGAAIEGLPLPARLWGAERPNSQGLDLTVLAHFAPLHAAWQRCTVATVPDVALAEVPALFNRAQAAFTAWDARPVAERAAALRRAADAMQAQLAPLCALLVKEAHKTWGDCVAEVREAIDFLRYYATEAERCMQPIALPSVTGETNTLRLAGRGVWVAISPWNFPLAIFTGQVAAALVTGNSVVAKPAEQAPAIAAEAVRLLRAAGVPADVLQLAPGAGDTVGAALVAHPAVAGVVFTGSTQVAKRIQRALAAKEGAIVPLIAETGGINAMLVDSTALPEQVADAVLQSAFRSAGQRCSALRLLCVHESIADTVIEMVAGAARELVLGPPHELATDVGPLIDGPACAAVAAQVQRLQFEEKVLVGHMNTAQPAINCVAPVMVEVASIGALRQEIFGPVLHIVRWQGEPQAVIAQINALGYGLTLGIQTRIDHRAAQLATQARVGNVYVNRNIIGAVVGSQPFGGEGLSGTGPKAGGPHYLARFCAERTVTVNTTAAGGNVALLAG